MLGWSSHWASVWWSKYYFDGLKMKPWVAGLDLGHSKLFIFIFVKLQKYIETNWKDFCKEFCKKSWKKNNIWNIRRLVDDSFVPSSKRPSIWYCKLTNFNWERSRQKLTFSLYKNCTCTNWPASKIQKLVVLHKLRLNWLHSQNS